MTMQEVHLYKADLKKEELSIQKSLAQQWVMQFQVMRAADDETYMKVQTYMLQFACNKGMIFLPENNQFKEVKQKKAQNHSQHIYRRASEKESKGK